MHEPPSAGRAHPRRGVRRRRRRGFRGDGEILANPIGTIPMIGGRLARATFEPDLAMTDGEAKLIANDEADAVGRRRWSSSTSTRTGTMFDWVWNGKRHVMMGATQVDQYGNQNIAAIGDYAKPRTQLLGYRGAPGNTINDATSYWVAEPRRRRWSCAAVDTVCGIGYDRAAALGPVGRPLPRDPPGRHQPLRARLRDARPPHAPPLGAPGRDRRRGASPPPASSSWCPTTWPSPACRRTTSSTSSATSSTPPPPASARSRTRSRRLPDSLAMEVTAGGWSKRKVAGRGWGGAGRDRAARRRRHRGDDPDEVVELADDPTTTSGPDETTSTTDATSTSTTTTTAAPPPTTTEPTVPPTTSRAEPPPPPPPPTTPPTTAPPGPHLRGGGRREPSGRSSRRTTREGRPGSSRPASGRAPPPCPRVSSGVTTPSPTSSSGT